jgi:hypothetical protein
MKNFWKFSFGWFVLMFVGCSGTSNTVIPPANGGITEEQFQETQVQPNAEVFGRPVDGGGDEAPAK